MVEAQASDFALHEQAQDQTVRRLEDVWFLHAERGQFVDVEEAAIVDFIRRHLPERQPIGLIVEKIVEQVEAVRIVLVAVEDGDILLDEFAHRSAGVGQRLQPALDDFLFAIAFVNLERLRVRARRQMAEGGQDALILHELRRFLAERLFYFIEMEPQTNERSLRRDGKAVVEVANRESAGFVAKYEVSRFEHLAVGLAEEAQQDPVAQLDLARPPIDIEESRMTGAGAIFEDVVPPFVLIADDAHVVGNDVEDLAHAVGMQGLDPGFIVRLGADFRIEGLVIGDIVAVLAAGPGFEIGGRITVGDAQVVKIGDEGEGIAKRKAGVKLQAIRRIRHATIAVGQRDQLFQRGIDTCRFVHWRWHVLFHLPTSTVSAHPPSYRSGAG